MVQNVSLWRSKLANSRHPLHQIMPCPNPIPSVSFSYMAFEGIPERRGRLQGRILAVMIAEEQRRIVGYDQ